MDSAIYCTATVETFGPTGVEMEALTAVQVALLTIYDMCKAVDRGMTMTDVRLLEKQGGKSGTYLAKASVKANVKATLKAKSTVKSTLKSPAKPPVKAAAKLAHRRVAG